LRGLVFNVLLQSILTFKQKNPLGVNSGNGEGLVDQVKMGGVVVLRTRPVQGTVQHGVSPLHVRP